MDVRRRFWTALVLSCAISSGVADLEAARGGEEIPTLPSRHLSDQAQSDRSIGVETTGFQLSDPGPITGPPRVPADVPDIPTDVSDVPSRLPAVEPPPSPPSPSHDQPAGACGPVSCQPCDMTCREGWLEHSVVFLAGDGWKNIFDDDDNNNFGFRAGLNLGVDIPGDHRVRGQVGASYGAYDFHGREELLSRDDPIEQQMFATAGVYKRSDVAAGDPLAWGVVYDLLLSDAAGERADRLRLGQLRSRVGWAVSQHDEIGVWTAFRIMRDHARRQNVRVDATDQANLFWHHNWSTGGDTSAYVGWADDPGCVVLGLDGQVPLNRRAALFGRVHYIVPSTTGGDIHPTLGVDDVFSQEAWNISLGVMFFARPLAASPTVSGPRGLPLLPVADNGTFSYQAGMF